MHAFFNLPGLQVELEAAADRIHGYKGDFQQQLQDDQQQLQADLEQLQVGVQGYHCATRPGILSCTLVATAQIRHTGRVLAECKQAPLHGGVCAHISMCTACLPPYPSCHVLLHCRQLLRSSPALGACRQLRNDCLRSKILRHNLMSWTSWLRHTG